MKIAFADFWDRFDPQNNFFVDLLSTFTTVEVVPHNNQPDVLIYSCFGHQHHYVNRSKTKKIYYTGENLRPNFNECDYSLTFDFDDYGGKNFRLPLWFINIDWFNKKNYGNPQFVVPLRAMKDNLLMHKPKEKFCTFVFNTNSPHRFEIVEKLSKYKKVDCYGTPFNNWFYGEDIKLKTTSDYKFELCFENRIHPGYYTNRILHAKAAGCVPLYWADNNCEKDFNPNSFLNFYNFKNIDEYVEKIIELDTNKEAFDTIKTNYLFEGKEPSLGPLMAFFNKIL